MPRKTNKNLCFKFYLWIVLEPTDKPCKMHPLCSTRDDFAVIYIAGISPPLIRLLVFFPGLFTVMKRMRRTQMLTCTSPLHLHIKTWRLKASPCFGSSSLICPAPVANLRPLQRLVLWAYKIYNNRVVRVTHLKICISCFAGIWAKAFPELESQNNMRPTSPVHGAHLFFNAIWTYPDWDPRWQNRVVSNSEKQPGYAWCKGKRKNIPQTVVDFVRGVSRHTESFVEFLLRILVFGLTVKDLMWKLWYITDRNTHTNAILSV